ncbi:family 16 glycosylhydrolase [Granulosicoccus sp.]|nr:family 16 glycosylhydrolase [Granulosicoccus sp.]MDB4223151.1 family 16 glycosylhydrolase [Granulosicoccus sp.]
MSNNKRVGTYLLLAIVSLFATMAQAINAPSDPRGTEVGQSLVKWEWNHVPEAVNYEVTIDGINRGLTSDSKFYSNNLWAGEHSMTARAIGADGIYSSKSNTVKINVNPQYNSGNYNRSYVVNQGVSNTGSVAISPVASSSSASIQIPQDPRGTEQSNRSVKWEWEGVPDAVNYDVTVDGNFAGTTADTQYTSDSLWTGDHSMSVKAVNASGTRSQQSLTAKINVTGSATSSTIITESTTYIAPPPPSDDSNAANVESMIDPASYGYPEIYQKSGFELVFSDEFNGNALNPYRWHTQMRWDGEFNGERYEYRVINGENQLYVNIFSDDQEHIEKIVPQYNPFQFDGSTLAIRAVKNPLKTNDDKRTFGSLSEISSQQDFLSGAIATHNKFSQKYGYFEARIKIPNHDGTFPAFWLFHNKRAWEGTQRTEIDIMENLGHAPWYIYNSAHYFKNVSSSNYGDANFLKPAPSGQIYTGTDYSQDYHVYAVKWEPGRVTWFIDDQQVSVLENNELNYEELYVKLNLAIGGDWTNFPANAGGLGRASDDRFPTQNDLDNFRNPALEIDYVRVYSAQ